MRLLMRDDEISDRVLYFGSCRIVEQHNKSYGPTAGNLSCWLCPTSRLTLVPSPLSTIFLRRSRTPDHGEQVRVSHGGEP